MAQTPGRLVVGATHLTGALAGAKKRAATAIGAPAIPDVRCACKLGCCLSAARQTWQLSSSEFR